MLAALRRAAPYAAVGTVAALVLLLSTHVAAADAGPSKSDFSARAGALLGSSSFRFLTSGVTVIQVDAIELLPLVPGTVTAMAWASTERALGRRVLVPRWLVDGKSHPYGGSGQPTTVLALQSKDADAMISSGLYVEFLG